MSKDPEDRLCRHVRDARRGPSTHKQCWVRGLLLKQRYPKLEILFEVPESHWQDYERAYIRIFRDSGCRLVNGTDGGEGCLNPTPEAREKRRQASIGRKHSSEAREKIRRANVGKKVSVETLEKMRQVNLGRKHSSVTREKMRQTRLGKKRPYETCEKMRKANLGKKMSYEAREKMRLAKLGKKQSPETLAKRLATLKANRA